jgi:hypothetical protein
MDPRRRFLLAVSALAIGAGVPAAANAQTLDPEQCFPGSAAALTDEECACMLALEEGTIRALEDFLRRFPPDPNGEVSACAALALEALRQFTPVDDETFERPTPQPPGPPNGPY